MPDNVTENLDAVFEVKTSDDFLLEISEDASKELAIIPEVVVEESTDMTPTPPGELVELTTATEEAEEDFKTSRYNLQILVERGNVALDGILDLAGSMDSPRAYEVVATLIKTLSDTNEALLSQHKKIAELRGVDTGKGGIGDISNIENAVFVGSTHELQKLIKGKQDAGDSTGSS
jgi:hypothetical protein